MELPFIWIFTRGERHPSGDRRTAATAGTGRPFPESPWRPLRCDGSKHAAGPGIQSTNRLTRALVPQEYPSVQEWARLDGDFFTPDTAVCQYGLLRSPARIRHSAPMTCGTPRLVQILRVP
ncbi:hypothetical protein GCM10022232_16510 [Streptomyces plumbiresistens]|uniref:Uncharacterized protein n=1 Tax=Streptomyces plumbiresistens TaxID=511811 RepID=A0ABP7QLD1_9ACTN